MLFRSLFWPATLNYSDHRTPTKIFTHGFLTVNGEKMSKSRGTFITARSYLEHIKDPNFIRYYYDTKLNSSMEDLDLNLEDFVAKNNSDLIGKFINIPSRTSDFIKVDGISLWLKNLPTNPDVRLGIFINFPIKSLLFLATKSSRFKSRSSIEEFSFVA